MHRRLILLLTLGFLVAIALCVGIGYFVWATFIGPPPGVGPKAEQGYQACAPFIDGLARYHEQHGAYPESLAALAPASQTDVSPVDGPIEIAYRVTDTSYQLEFRYTGPGMNICTFTPEIGWHCTGYF
jgi:hypothetical protein